VSAQVIDGNAIARQVRDELAGRIATLKQRGVQPGLAVILVGENPASVTYVRHKMKDSSELAILAETVRLPASVSQDELLATVARLNADPAFHGIIVQTPLPDQIDTELALSAVDPHKDVDGQHPASQGRLLRGLPTYLPATPAGVQQLLVRSGHPPDGKHVVICGRSALVGRPLAALLVQKQQGANATVTLCHTATRDMASFTRQADILVAAMGSPRSITADMVREGVVVIDVGTNPAADPSKKSGQRLVGDVDYDAVSEKAAAITPVPGGVGPMTRAMLLVNTVIAAEGGPK
jgi:methylenetetrahydrofolate dehydrogenase (NADP+)/methenyltetrahydrofolate cyclohydrolase